MGSGLDLRLSAVGGWPQLARAFCQAVFLLGEDVCTPVGVVQLD